MKKFTKYVLLMVAIVLSSSLVMAQVTTAIPVSPEKAGMTTLKKDVLTEQELEAMHGPSVFIPAPPEGGSRAQGDNCSDPIPITLPAAMPYTNVNTTLNRGNDYSTTCLGYYDDGPDIIYQLNVTSETTAQFTCAQVGSGWGGMALGNTCPPSSTCLIYATASSGSFGFQYTLSPGTYYLMIDNWPTPNYIDFTLTIGAPVLLCANTCATANNYGNVNDPSVTARIDSYGACWYTVTNNTADDMTVTASLCGSGFDTKIDAYETCSGSSIAYNDDYCGVASQISFIMPAGASRILKVYGWSSSFGIYTLNVTGVPIPANDECANAELITGSYPQTVYGTTVGATVDCPGVLDWNAVWYEIELPYCLNDLTIDWCANSPALTNTGIVYYDECGNCNAYTLLNYNSCAGGWVVYADAIQGPGTILFPAFTGNAMDFQFTVNVTSNTETPLGSVEGHVTNYNGLPVVGAEVSVPDQGRSAVTNAAGYYFIECLPEGTWDAICSKTGYNESSSTINIVGGTTITTDFTLTQPNMVVQPLIVDQTLNPNEYFTFSMSVLNNGNGPLDWEAAIEYPAAAAYPRYGNSNNGQNTYGDVSDPLAINRKTAQDQVISAGSRAVGDVLFSFTAPSPMSLCWGLAHDGTNLWITDPNLSTTTIYEVTPEGDMTGNTITVSLGQVWIGDMTSDGTYLYACLVGGPNTIAKIDLATGAVVGQISGAWTYTSARGLAYDAINDEFYIGGWNDYTVYRVSGTGASIDSYYFGPISGLEWHPQGGPDGAGSLWVVTNEYDPSYVTELDPNNGWASLQSFTIPGYQYYSGAGAALDPTGALWIANQAESKVYLVDLGEPWSGGGGGWLTMDYYEGNVLPFGGTNNIPTHMDASGTVQGEVYTANIVFTSDPNVGTITVPVTMRILGPTLNPPTNLTVTLVNDLTGEVLVDWDWAGARAFQFFLVKRDGALVATTTSTSFTEILPDYGEYCYTVQAIYDEGETAPVGPECIEWANPSIFIDPDNLEEWVWPDHQVKVYTTISNLGIGTLHYEFPDWVGTTSSPAGPVTINLPAGPANAPENTAVAAGAFKARPESTYTVERGNGSRSGVNVLLAAADDATNIQTLLVAFGDLGLVDYFDARNATPTLGQLQAYDVVLTWSNYNYSSAAGMGDVLADYVDGGGKVINLMFSLGTHGWAMTGRFMNEGYTALNGTSLLFSNSCLGTFDATHPIMAGVTSVCDGYRLSGTNLTAGSSDIADWSDGQIFVAAKDNQSVVSINGYVGDTYIWTGQMPTVLHNAINWVGAPGFIVAVEPAMANIPAGGSQVVEITYDATGFDPGTYTEELTGVSNDPAHLEFTIGNTMHVYLPGALSGLVTDCDDDSPLAGVTVTVTPGSYTTQTDDAGNYYLMLDAGTYNLTFSKPAYNGKTVNGVVVIANNETVINVCLEDSPYPPGFVHAEVLNNDTQCEVTWGLPTGPYEILMDDGTAEDLFVWNTPGSQSAVKFTPASYPAEIIGGRFFVGDGTFPAPFLDSEFGVAIYDDNGPGGMPGTMLSSGGVTVNNYGWVVMDGLSATIESGNFYLAMIQVGFGASSAPLGVDETTPTYYKSYTKFQGNDWQLSAYQDFMIRAWVIGDQGAARDVAEIGARVVPSKPVDWAERYTSQSGRPPFVASGIERAGEFRGVTGLENRDLVVYEIARLSNFTPPDPFSGTVTPRDTLLAQNFFDTQWANLPEGWYAYAVRAKHSSGEYSEWIASNIVPHKLDVMVTVNVTLSTGEEPSGVSVTMVGENYPNTTHSGITPVSGTLVFDPVYEGNYTLTATKAGYDDYYIANIFVNEDDLVIDIVMAEKKYPARNLYVDPVTLDATWDKPLLIGDLQTFEDETFPPSGWSIYDLDTSATWVRTDSASSPFWVVPEGDGYYACINDDAVQNHIANDYLIMPPVDIERFEMFTLNFRSFFDGIYGGSAYVAYSTDGSSWNDFYTVPASDEWIDLSLDITGFSGGGYERIWFAFHYTDNGQWADGWAIDNVQFNRHPHFIDYYVFLDEGYVGDTINEEWNYIPLDYGVQHTAAVAARYTSGVSEKIYYTFMSRYLLPPTDLTGFAPDDAAILMWVAPVAPAGQVLSVNTVGPAPQGEIRTSANAPGSSLTNDGSGQPSGDRALTTCPEESFFSYVVDIDNATVCVSSEELEGYPYKVYQKVTNLADEVGKVTFWGISLTYSGGWFICSGEAPMNFLVEFWRDGNTPGPNIASYLVTATVTNVGNLWGQYPLYEYSVEFPNVDMTTGWISIQGQAAEEGTDCKFLWVSTETNYGPVLQWDGVSYNDPGYGVSQSICLAKGASSGGEVPENLLGYNVYRDGDFVKYVAHPTVNYVDEGLDIGEYCYTVTGVYDLTDYGFPGETGESMEEGPACVTVDYCFPLDFSEMWDLGSFDANQWVSGDNWRVNGQAGHPAPAAEFTWDPIMVDYKSSITSYPLCADAITEGNIWFDYDFMLDAVTSGGKDTLLAQIWTPGAQSWMTLKTYTNASGDIAWTSEHLNINDYAKGNVFRIRFLAQGKSTLNILSWMVDNVHIYRVCDPALNLTAQADYSGDGIRLNWMDPQGGSSFGDWLFWHNGTFYGGVGYGQATVWNAAARWEPQQLAGYDGASVTQIAFIPYDITGTFKVKVWAGGDISGPDELVAEQTVASFVAGEWNTITLTTPLLIDVTRNLWVGIEINDSGTGYPAGNDTGPAIAGFGDMIGDASGWVSMSQTYGLDYNWMIEAYVVSADGAVMPLGIPVEKPEGNASLTPQVSVNAVATHPVLNNTNASRAVTGYQVWRNENDGEYGIIDFSPVTTYLDGGPLSTGSMYCYMVQAVYEGGDGDYCESALSNDACEVWALGIDDPAGSTSFSLYPNPANDHVFITTSGDLKRVTVYNALGQLIMDEITTGPQYELKTAGYTIGVYMVRVETAAGVTTRTLAIQR